MKRFNAHSFLRLTFAGVLLMGMGMHSFYAAPEATVRSVSSRPEAVSGGDVLLQISVSQTSNWHVRLNGRDVTSAFRPAEDVDATLALLSGLNVGENILELRLNSAVKSRLTLVNHPLSGPIFSGPHQTPFICQTEANGLGPPLDAACNAKTVVRYYYKSTEPFATSVLDKLNATFDPDPKSLSPGFKPYDPSLPAPSDWRKPSPPMARRCPLSCGGRSAR